MTSVEKNHFFKNFIYAKPPALSRLTLLKRRVKQLKQLLFSKNFQDTRSLCQGVKNHYSLEEEIEFYDKYCQFGLHENEAEAFETAINSKVYKPNSALIIGCGAGREALYFAKSDVFSKIVAIDNSEQMIQRANKSHPNSSVSFQCRELSQLDEKFDFIWVTAILESHIHSEKARIIFFKSIKKLCKPEAHIIFTPQIKKLHWRQSYFWSSQLLRLRWRGKSMWQQGDVVLANLGAHHMVEQLVFSHFYPTENHFINELNSAGLKVSVKRPQNSWTVTL